MKHPRKYNMSIVATGALVAFLLLIQSAAAVDYDTFIFRPPAQKQSFLDTYLLKYFQSTIFDGSYAMVIAIGDYDHLPDLDAVSADAEKMKTFLLETAEYHEVVVLQDEDASFSTIRYFMEDYFPRKLRKGRHRFLFYFSGHGAQRPGTHGLIGFLQLKEATQDSTFNSITMHQIENWSEQYSSATHMLFLLDACFSGLAGVETKNYTTDVDPLDLAQKTGRFMLTAGTANETSIASRKRWNGSLFTDVVIHGMRGAADFNKDQVVTTYELFSYTQAAVTWEAKRARHTQTPLISNLGSFADTGQYFFVYQDPEPPQIEVVEPPADEEKKHAQVIMLRSDPITTATPEDLGLREHEFDWGTGWVPQQYIDNQFDDQGEVIVDHATGLMWQQSGSDWLTYEDALKYIDDLNRQKFAGYDDWRLPTIPELASLLEPEKQSNDLYINPMFDSKQWWWWSADRPPDSGSSSAAWLVDFSLGVVIWHTLDYSRYVRAVRS